MNRTLAFTMAVTGIFAASYGALILHEKNVPIPVERDICAHVKDGKFVTAETEGALKVCAPKVGTTP